MLRLPAAVLLLTVSASSSPFGRKEGVQVPLLDVSAGIPLAPFASLALDFPSSATGKVAKAGLGVTERLRKAGKCVGLAHRGRGRLLCIAPMHVISGCLCALRCAWIALTEVSDGKRTEASQLVDDLVTVHASLLKAALRAQKLCRDRWDWMSEEFESVGVKRWCIMGEEGQPPSPVLLELDRSLGEATRLLNSQSMVSFLLKLKAAQPPAQFHVRVDRGEWHGDAEGALKRDIVLGNGVAVPRIGFGTGCGGMDENRYEACGMFSLFCRRNMDKIAVVKMARAMKLGYRLFDTAMLVSQACCLPLLTALRAPAALPRTYRSPSMQYDNFELLGNAIRYSIHKGTLKSAAELFISTKVGLNEGISPAESAKGRGVGVNTPAEIARQMHLLGVPFVHMAEIHHTDAYSQEQNTETRKQLAALNKQGLVLALVDDLNENDRWTPADFHPVGVQTALHLVFSDNGWDGIDNSLLAARENVTPIVFDLYRDQGLPLVMELLESLAALSGMSDKFALVYAWALRKDVIVLTSSGSSEHLRTSFRDPFLALPKSIFAATDALAWLTSWCPPCGTSNDAFGILEGLYRVGDVWQALKENDVCLTNECEKY